MDKEEQRESVEKEESVQVGVGCGGMATFEEFLRQRQQEQTATTSVVDESPLKLNRNKESLKLKLQMRRPINQLVEQGILPAPHTPVAFASQRVKLERARMSDLLKAKIQQRPSRQELVRQHILEETDSRVAPLLAEKQRMLKRARLADSLNDHLIHRPGPLELVKKNILHAPDIEKAIKEGIVPFKATCEGATPGPSLPTKYIICQEDDSSSSDLSNNFTTPPSEESLTTPTTPVLTTPTTPVLTTPTPIVTPIITKIELLPVVTPTTTSYPFAISEQPNLFSSFQFTTTTPPTTVYTHGSSSLKSRSKKSKPKSQQAKAKTIKFHEYKGPPTAKTLQDGGGLNKPPESSYELLLQQQQLFLQWQLEWQHRFPKILLPAVSKLPPPEVSTFSSSFTPPPPPQQPLSKVSSPSEINNFPEVLIVSTGQTAPETTLVITPTTPTAVTDKKGLQKSLYPLKLSEWKVNELKGELKKRNLPVSGSKSQLLDRLQSSYKKNPPPNNNNLPLSFLPQQKQTEVKFFISPVGGAVFPVTPNSRSVLQQKIVQKMQQQAIKCLQEDTPTPPPPPTKTDSPVAEEGWVLKINDQDANKTDFQKSFENCLADLLKDDHIDHINTDHTHIDHAQEVPHQPEEHVKSQMVDDVLEILIRNGELPATAATAGTNTTAQNTKFTPPPAPPLPPSTFAITLPTEITYKRVIPTATNDDHHQPPPQIERKSSLGMTLLTKEAEEILKISEELATFGQEHHNRMDHSSKMIDDLLINNDNDFPMDTEYSDWLESFTTSTTEEQFNNNNNNVLLKEDTSNNDPLLSSKSGRFNILDNNGLDMDTSEQTDLNCVKDNNNLHHDLSWDFTF